MKLADRLWFQIMERGWRHFQQWGFAIAAVVYGFRPVFDYSFQVETFAALAAAGGVGFVTRGIEKVGHAAVKSKDSE